jgi:hypothetical protein
MITFLAPLLFSAYSAEFNMHTAIDPALHKAAYRYLLPKGWKSADSVTWDLTNKLHPVSTSSTLTSPDGKTQIAILPTEAMMFQVQNGQLSGTMPPDTATKALDNVLAATHPNLKSANLVVRKDYDVPTPFDSQGLKTKGMVGILEVSFEQDGKQLTELLSTTEYEGSHQGDGGLVQGLWMMMSGYSLTCEGQITKDDFYTFATVVSSHRADPIFFASVMDVSSRQQTGPVDLKSVSDSVKGLDDSSKASYADSLKYRSQSIAKMFPIYSGQTEVSTLDGPLSSYTGLHVWMKKPNGYFVTDSSDSPGSGWEAAKASG